MKINRTVRFPMAVNFRLYFLCRLALALDAGFYGGRPLEQERGLSLIHILNNSTEPLIIKDAVASIWELHSAKWFDRYGCCLLYTSWQRES